MLAAAVRLVRGPETAAAARRVMFTSLFYLPLVLLVMVLDRI
jgi:heme O synthase-like polyprenyltransferase